MRVLEKNSGTINDKTGNYRRVTGTIDDGKKRTRYKKKNHSEVAVSGSLPPSTRNNYRRRFGPRLLHGPCLEKQAYLATAAMTDF